jgi:N-acetylglucosaminyldiphosphoundecaprenol N-acetyl-beta-D-mannosaminyltransferase
MMKTGKMMGKSKQNFEAESESGNRYKDIIWGVKISSRNTEGVLNEIDRKCNINDYTKPLFIVTAYSEFFLEQKKDITLARALKKADLIIPDGVSAAAAAEYLNIRSGNQVRNLWLGMKIGAEILKGKFKDKTVTGVSLTDLLLKTASQKGRRVFIAGGRKEAAEILIGENKGEIEGYQEEQKYNNESQIGDAAVVGMINQFKPDIVLVAFGRFEAEKWIARNLNKIQTKVIMGIGSSLDELAGVGPWKKPVPEWVSRMGLKWLWRVTVDPKHWKRAWNAFPVFAWKVYRG